ncbi:MAG: AAA family ATPase [Thermoplasmatota archaeon]
MVDGAGAGPRGSNLAGIFSGEWKIGPSELAKILLELPISDLRAISLPEGVIPALEIDRISIDGFGPHDGPNILELTDGLTLVTGKNGTGKTHMLLAVHWCLFGERGSLDPWMSEIDPMGRDLLNWNRSGKGAARMKVEVDFVWNRDSYTAYRGLEDGVESHGIMCRKGRKEVPLDGYPENLSPNILPYLLFQGEAVMFLASEDPFLSESNLRSVISKLSGAEALMNGLQTISGAREALFELARERRKVVAPLESELRSLVSELSVIEKGQKDAKKRVETLSKDRNRARSAYQKRVAELSKGGLLPREEEEAASARARVPVLSERLSEMLGSAGRELLRKMAEDALAAGLREKNERTERKMMVGAFEAQISIVRNVLATGRCMCGTEVGKTGMGRERIKALLSRLEERKREISRDLADPIWTSDQVLEGVRRCLAAPGFSRKDYIDRIGELEEANHAVIRKSYRVEDRQEVLEELVSLVREMERSATLLERERKDLRRFSDRRKELISGQRRTERKLAAAWGVEDGESGFRDRLEALDMTIEGLEEEIEKRMESMREEIENRSNSILSRLDQGGKLGGLRIHGTTYRIGRTFSDEGGERVLPMAYLSAGERELAALAVLSSIPGISGGILVLDSPFPYIDSGRRESIIEGLPEISRRVLISLPEGTMSRGELKRSKEAWDRKGLGFRHYRLKMGKNGSMLEHPGSDVT